MNDWTDMGYTDDEGITFKGKVTVPADWKPQQCDLCGHELAKHDPWQSIYTRSPRRLFACRLCECDGTPQADDDKQPGELPR